MLRFISNVKLLSYLFLLEIVNGRDTYIRFIETTFMSGQNMAKCLLGSSSTTGNA